MLWCARRVWSGNVLSFGLVHWRRGAVLSAPRRAPLQPVSGAARVSCPPSQTQLQETSFLIRMASERAFQSRKSRACRTSR
eukprot:844162-Rhodomonas_salina.5